MTVNAIDILFLIMVTFGFYFGYTFGLMKLALVLFSFLFATIAAMSFTPMTSGIIQETFGVESVFLPFAAFGITLVIVLMLARMITKLVEETLTSERFDVLSRLVGGVLMALWFTLLYSVLVIFFGKSGVLPLIFNENVAVYPADGTIHIGVAPKTIGLGPKDTLLLKITNDPNTYTFESSQSNTPNLPNQPKKKGGISLSLGFVPIGNEEHQAYINNKGRTWSINPTDTARIQTRRQLFVTNEKETICFCDSAFLIYPQGDALLLDCSDPMLSAQSATSFFYPYIEIIPKRGNQLMSGLRPLIKDFVEYMNIALERVEQRPIPNNTVDAYDEEQNRQQVQPVEEDDPAPTPNPPAPAPSDTTSML